MARQHPDARVAATACAPVVPSARSDSPASSSGPGDPDDSGGPGDESRSAAVHHDSATPRRDIEPASRPDLTPTISGQPATSDPHPAGSEPAAKGQPTTIGRTRTPNAAVPGRPEPAARLAPGEGNVGLGSPVTVCPGHPAGAAAARPSAGELLAGYLTRQASAFLRALRTRGDDAAAAPDEQAHAPLLRAARRIGSSLLSFASLMDTEWAWALGQELGWLAGALSREQEYATRLDRLLTALRRLSGGLASSSDLPAIGAARAGALLDRQLTLARTREHSAALETLGSARFHALADAVALLASEVPLTAGAREPAEVALWPLAEAVYRRVTEAAGALPLGRAALAYNGEALGTALFPRQATEKAVGNRPAGASGAGPARSPQGASRPPGGSSGRSDVAAGGGMQPGRRPGPAPVRTGVSAGGGSRRVVAKASAGGAPAPAPAAMPADPDALWYDLRLLTDRSRYTLEVCGAPREPVSGQLARAAVVLRRHEEAAAAAEAAAGAASTPRITPATAYALGVLHADQRREVEAARYLFSRLWNRPTTPVT